MLDLTRKPIVLVTYDLAGMLDGLEMAEVVAGGRAPHAERPQVAVYINVTRGLLFNEDSVRKLLACAERGVPALWIPVTSGGTTGPVTLAGTIAINTAGVLAGVVLAQLAREGTPVVVPGFGGDSLDLRTMVDPYAGPEPKGVAASLAHRWGLPDVQPRRRQRLQGRRRAGGGRGRHDDARRRARRRPPHPRLRLPGVGPHRLARAARRSATSWPAGSTPWSARSTSPTRRWPSTSSRPTASTARTSSSTTRSPTTASGGTRR